MPRTSSFSAACLNDVRELCVMSDDPADLELFYSDSCLDGEKHAALTLFAPPLPTEHKACVTFIRDCLDFLRRYACAPHIDVTDPTATFKLRDQLEARCNHLKYLATSTTCPERAQACAREAQSLVASMVFRFGEPQGLLQQKAYMACVPGNVVEMMSWLLRTSEADRASEIELDEPDAMPKLKSLFSRACVPPDGWRSSPDNAAYDTSYDIAPAPDALIEAARQQRSFDDLRRQGWLSDYSPGTSGAWC